MKQPFKSYNGGKSASGVYQAIINQIPPHDVYVAGCAGNCGIMANKLPASVNLAIDLDERVIDGWAEIKGVTAIKADIVQYLEMFFIARNQRFFSSLTRHI